ncbi:delta 1-pyrroline-5-carboxylate dehydrogenase [Peribacillus cavernae]|nr:delta 1-pyrroline-5-carboxylate dehydrogenase [Peribacillus cavernae]
MTFPYKHEPFTDFSTKENQQACFNRDCTGALVGYQPFGGFNMSGTDSKAGGPDYLILHMQAKTTSEML